eukprot:6092121-Pyramimonas_sp.AAC.1
MSAATRARSSAKPGMHTGVESLLLSISLRTGFNAMAKSTSERGRPCFIPRRAQKPASALEAESRRMRIVVQTWERRAAMAVII